MGKSALGSKLTWVGGLTAIVSFLTTLQESEVIAQNPQLVGWVGVAVGVGTVLLRIFGTSKPVTSILPKSE